MIEGKDKPSEIDPSSRKVRNESGPAGGAESSKRGDDEATTDEHEKGIPRKRLRETLEDQIEQGRMRRAELMDQRRLQARDKDIQTASSNKDNPMSEAVRNIFDQM